MITSKQTLLLLWLFFLCATSLAYPQGNPNDLVARGQYIFAVSGGCACHSERKGVYHAGARPFQIPIGTVYSTNLTSDPETGLGKWTLQNFRDTLRTGRRMGRGREILPPMPIPMYKNLTDDDIESIFTYLQSIPAVKNHVPEPLPPPEAPAAK